MDAPGILHKSLGEVQSNWCNSSLNENYDYVYRVIISKTRPKSKQQLLLVSFHLFSIDLDIIELGYITLHYFQLCVL